jgi:hypothetical protein
MPYPGFMACYIPPGWPVGVHPPGSDRFEQTAVTWLLDVVPPDYRVHGVLLRHPPALAALARHHLAACVQGAREGYRSARSELSGQLPPRGVQAVLAAYCDEGGRLVKTARAVDLVARALRGEIFAPQPAQGSGAVALESEDSPRQGGAVPAKASTEQSSRESSSRVGIAGPPPRAGNIDEADPQALAMAPAGVPGGIGPPGRKRR